MSTVKCQASEQVSFSENLIHNSQLSSSHTCQPPIGI
uniref:Uncharacterized protein n=1 Tax=Rhizophora mucronata TaxID=61149 RepID=A0A2P2QV72_RHIMU